MKFVPFFRRRFARWVGRVVILGFLGGMATVKATPFTEFVRKTEPLTPEQEQKSFHLPPGFEIQLVASEPEIGKPINMAFDARGRLWVSQSREYPFPAPTNRVRESWADRDPGCGV
jgi:hypothetical protein